MQSYNADMSGLWMKNAKHAINYKLLETIIMAGKISQTSAAEWCIKNNISVALN